MLALSSMLLATSASAAPSSWTVAPGSKLTFQGAMNATAFTGAFRQWTAKIVFDPKALAASKFAHASFVTRDFRDLGGGRYATDGDLTIRGIRKPVTLPFTLAISGDTARMNGSVVLNRTAFGIGQGQWKTGEVVATEVTVSVALTAHRAH